ncbi:hypothetical protein TSUD_335820 [Trifolium subterraneum]|uniref:Uncharacterized protein n=1 Tax=Trifolium subterraneum TaxID=3900 RepID=A0A2Z6LRC3_TRISU|nr:hypothetical protein TSUD_335820 [Trifolium subterraneum]
MLATSHRQRAKIRRNGDHRSPRRLKKKGSYSDKTYQKEPKRSAQGSGQPLGYLASWPLFTLSHHLVVCGEDISGWGSALISRLIWKLQQAFRPKDLVVPPTSTYKSETFEYLEDMTLLRSWTEAWLKYVRWYYATALSPDGVRTSLMLRLRLIENCCGETIAEAGLDPKPLTILARENPRPVEVDPAVVVDPVH